MPFPRGHIDVVKRGARLAVRQLAVKRLQISELRDRADRLPVPERLAALSHLDRLVPTEAWAKRTQVVGELCHLRSEIRIAERVAEQLGKLVALFRSQRR